jgi:hypothetical protein
MSLPGGPRRLRNPYGALFKARGCFVVFRIAGWAVEKIHGLLSLKHELRRLASPS